MSINIWMDKEVAVHIHNGILLSHKKELIWLSSNKVDEPTAYYTKWSQSESEKLISYINAYICNLERWYLWSNMQDSKEDAGIKNRLLDTVGEGEGGMIWENSIETYTLPSPYWDALEPLLESNNHINMGVWSFLFCSMSSEYWGKFSNNQMIWH